MYSICLLNGTWSSIPKDICQSHCSCGKRSRPNGHPATGYKALPNEFPWLAMIKYKWDKSYVFLCGGVLIHERWVLTSSKCVNAAKEKFGELNKDSFQIILGEHDTNKIESTEKSKKVVNVVLHHTHGFSLLELSDRVTFTQEISPVCLPLDPNERFHGRAGIVAGWGRDSVKLAKLPTVGFGYVNVTEENGECGYNEETHLCAHGINYQGEKDSECRAGGGGPLVIDISGKWTIVGIAAYDDKCLPGETQAGGYSRVTLGLQWIKETINFRPCQEYYTVVETSLTYDCNGLSDGH